MANFRAWVEKTRTGNFVVRYRDGKTRLPNGKWKVFHGGFIDKDQRMIVEGELRTAKWLANALKDRTEKKHLLGELGDFDLSNEIEPLLLQWMDDGKANNLAWSSIYNREVAIRSFCEETGSRTLQDLADKLESWKAQMVRGVPIKLKAGTIRCRLLRLKTFHRWLVDNEFMPTVKLPKKFIPAETEAVARFFTAEEFYRLDQAMARISYEARIGIHLCHSLGLRLVEIVGDGKERLEGVRWDDLQWSRDGSVDLLVRKEVTKGRKKERILRVPHSLIEMLGSRKSGPLVPLQRWKFWDYFDQARAMAGINKSLTVHGLRHSFAKNILQRGGATTFAARDLLGHGDIATTQIYSQFEKSYLARNVEDADNARIEEEALIRKGGIDLGFAGQLAGQKDGVGTDSLGLNGTVAHGDALIKIEDSPSVKAVQNHP